MILTVWQAKFRGAGAISCRHCEVQVRFPGSQWLTLMDDGNRTLYRSAVDLTVPHRCGSEPFYWCPRCDEEREPTRRYDPRRRGVGRRARVIDMTCSVCDSELQIRSRPRGVPGDRARQ